MYLHDFGFHFKSATKILITSLFKKCIGITF